MSPACLRCASDAVLALGSPFCEACERLLADPAALVVTVIEPVLERYSEAIAAHHLVWPVTPPGDPIRHACSCGWDPLVSGHGRSPARSVGLHAAAAQKRASRAYDADVDVLLEAWDGARLRAIRRAGRAQV